MKWAEGRIGRVFVLKLEDEDVIPDAIERFAKEQNVNEAFCIALGGVGRGRIVAGPLEGRAEPIMPLMEAVENIHEAAAVGTLFVSQDGTPRLHMHGALGRGESSRTGCFRTGVEVWKTFEVVLVEISGTGMKRMLDERSGFEVLTAE